MNNVLDNILGRMEEAQKNNRRLLLVIDGKCGSGKTTCLSGWVSDMGAMYSISTIFICR